MLEQRRKPESFEKLKNQEENQENNNIVIDPQLITIVNWIMTIDPVIVMQVLQRTINEMPDPELEEWMIRMYERMNIRRNQRTNAEQTNIIPDRSEPEPELQINSENLTEFEPQINTEEENQEQEERNEIRNRLIASTGRLILIYRIQISLETDEPDPLVENWVERIINERINQRINEEQTNEISDRSEPEIE